MEPNQQDRQGIMQQDALLVGIAGFSLLCGMHFSPYFDPAYILLRPFTPTFIVSSPLLTFYFTSLFVSLFAVIVAGVPAALYERFSGQRQTNLTSLLIWLGGVLLLALPTLLPQ